MKIGTGGQAPVRSDGGNWPHEEERRRFSDLLAPAGAGKAAAVPDGWRPSGQWRLTLHNGPLAGAVLHAQLRNGEVHLRIIGSGAAQRAHIAHCRARVREALAEVLACSVELEFDDAAF